MEVGWEPNMLLEMGLREAVLQCPASLWSRSEQAERPRKTTGRSSNPTDQKKIYGPIFFSSPLFVSPSIVRMSCTYYVD